MGPLLGKVIQIRENNTDSRTQTIEIQLLRKEDKLLKWIKQGAIIFVVETKQS